jgi:ankyrin repeat protein
MIALANVDKADPDLRTPLHCACSSTNVKVIKDLLAKSKSNVNAKVRYIQQWQSQSNS